MTTSLTDPFGRTKLTADVAIIGGGIVGSACAWRSAERGLKVTVLEAAPVLGAGSSGRSGAGVRVQWSEEVNVRLSWESIQEYRTFGERYGAESGYRPNGYLFLVPEAKWAEHSGGLAVQRRVGAPVEELAPDEAQALVPFVTGGVYRCSYGPADGYIDPVAVLNTYHKLAGRRGARLLLGAPVQTVRRLRDGWLLTTPQGSVSAPVVVNAAGAWAGEVAQLAGLRVPVVPVKRCVYRTVGGNSARSYPLTVDTGSNFWLRGHGDTVIYTVSRPDQAPGLDAGMDWGWLEKVREVSRIRFPWLEKLPVGQANSFWGYYEMTPDGAPVLGEAEGAPGWVNACGFSGHGVQQAAAVGRVVAAEVVGERPFIDVSTLRLERFAAGALRLERHLV